jgi:hypothetical protein
VKCELTETVQWQDGDALHVGKIVKAGGQHIIGRDSHGSNGTILVAHSYTRELEFVSYAALKPYPSEPIPEPTNTGARP